MLFSAMPEFNLESPKKSTLNAKHGSRSPQDTEYSMTRLFSLFPSTPEHLVIIRKCLGRVDFVRRAKLKFHSLYPAGRDIPEFLRRIRTRSIYLCAVRCRDLPAVRMALTRQ